MGQKKYWASEQGILKKKKLSKLGSGKNNYFYGKKHSKKTIEKMSQAKLGKPNIKDRKPVVIDGIEYNSITEASARLHVEKSKISHRLNSTNPKFKEWNYKFKKKETIPSKTGKPVKFRYKNIIFKSLTEACKKLHLTMTQIYFRAKSSNPKWNDYEIIR